MPGGTEKDADEVMRDIVRNGTDVACVISNAARLGNGCR